MNIFIRKLSKKNNTSHNKVLSSSAIKKAAKRSIEDQNKLSKQAAKLRSQTAVR